MEVQVVLAMSSTCLKMSTFQVGRKSQGDHTLQMFVVDPMD